jgi:hypothetical protein
LISIRCWICSINSSPHLQWYVLIIQNCFHFHMFELRKLTSDEVLKCLFSSVFRFLRTIARFFHFRILNF